MRTAWMRDSFSFFSMPKNWCTSVMRLQRSRRSSTLPAGSSTAATDFVTPLSDTDGDWSVGNEATDEALIGVEVGRRPQVHLVNRVAGVVEELQRALDIVAVALLDRETVRPDFREHPRSICSPSAIVACSPGSIFS